MLFAVATAFLWSASSVASARTAKYLGGGRGNLARLVLACLMLALWVFATGRQRWDGPALWFLASGVVGLGLGDIALFSAYARLGVRLPALLTHCFGVPLGAAIEWAWLGTPLHLGEGLCIAVILLGVATALAPDRHALVRDRRFLVGCGYGLLSACGLALAAVLSRRGYAAATAIGQPMDGIAAALLRNLGGVALCAAWLPLLPRPTLPVVWRTVAPWLAATAVAGPTLGVACYQLALARDKVGVVQAVVALVPLIVIPLAWWIEGERPAKRTWIGGALGVAGVAGIALLRG